MLRAAGLALAVLLGAAAQASAASAPITLDPNTSAGLPSVAVAADGTAHLAWMREDSTGDQVRYCRVSRTSDACNTIEAWTPDGANSYHAPIVLLRSATKVQIVVGRSAGSDVTWLYESTNGGNSFAAKKLIGNIAAETAIAGPGDNAITAVQATDSPLGNDRVQVMNTAGGTTTSAAFPVEGLDRTQYPGLALLNSSTPIYAYREHDNVKVRRFDPTKSGYNNAANWLPQTATPWPAGQLVIGEDLLGVASNPAAGAYLLTHLDLNGEADQDVLRVRRFNEQDGQLGAPIPATPVGEPSQGALTAGGDGALTAAWTKPADPSPIRTSVAPAGGAFGGAGTLVESASAYNLVVATAPDRGGIVAWDGNHGGPLQFARIPAGGQPADPPPPPPPGEPAPPAGGGTPAPAEVPGACKLTVKTGIEATALGGPGCWVEQPKKSGKYTFDGTVSINGLILTAPSGSKTGVVVDTKQHTVTAPKGTQQKAGAVVLSSRAVDWDFGKTSTQTFTKLETAVNGGPVRLLGFPVVGDASIAFSAGKATVQPRLQLPFPFDTPSATVSLELSLAGGLKLGGAEIYVKEAWIGPLQVKELRLRVDAGIERFDGTAAVRIPGTDADIKVTVAFEDGDLVQFAASATGLPPIAISPVIYLRGVGFNYQNDSKGFTVGGGAELAFPASDGPFWFDALGDPPGTGAGFSIHVPKGTKQVIISFGGDFEFGTQGSRFGFARVDAKLDSAAQQVTFGANVTLGYPGVLGIFGDFKGGIGYTTGAFYFNGSLNVCLLGCLDLQSIVSSSGAAACVDFFVTEILVGYRWGQGLDAGLTCDLGKYIPPEFGGSGATVPAKAAEAKPLLVSKDTVSVPPPGKDPKVYSIEVKGQPGGGVPGVRLTAAGTTLADNGNDTYTVQTAPPSPDDPLLLESDAGDLEKPVRAGDLLMVPNTATDSVRITLIRRSLEQIVKDGPGQFPAGRGAIRIEQAGGNPIAFGTQSRVRASGSRATRAQAAGGIAVAAEYPSSTVKASLSGTARKRTIRWDATQLGGPTGRTLVLLERDKAGAMKAIKRTTAGKGSTSWTIADGPGGRREVVAVIENATGVAVANTVVGTFTAPPPPSPSTPRVKLTVAKNGKATARWTAVRNAAKVLVTVQTGDGRRSTISTTKRSITIPQVGKTERLVVSVVGITKRGKLGKAGTAKRGRG